MSNIKQVACNSPKYNGIENKELKNKDRMTGKIPGGGDMVENGTDLKGKRKDRMGEA